METVSKSDPAGTGEVIRLDLATMSVRELNQYLHHELAGSNIANRNIAGGKPAETILNGRPRQRVEILNPAGQHNIAVGLDCNVQVDVLGHGGYFLAGMNKLADVSVHGNVGWSVAENIMSGSVRVRGNASQCAAASGHGGLVVIEGDASSRCGISMKGCDIVVGGNVGHMSAFMAQAGRLVVCGNAGAGLGDSLYEAVLYIRGTLHSLGADAREEPMTDDDVRQVSELLSRAVIDANPRDFKRVASARKLYHWNAEAHLDY